MLYKTRIDIMSTPPTSQNTHTRAVDSAVRALLGADDAFLGAGTLADIVIADAWQRVYRDHTDEVEDLVDVTVKRLFYAELQRRKQERETASNDRWNLAVPYLCNVCRKPDGANYTTQEMEALILQQLSVK